MDFDPAEQMKQMANQGIGGVISLNFDSTEDKALGVQFVTDWKENHKETREKGRPIYDPVEICEIVIPGSTDKIRNIVTDKERFRFPRQYEAFKKNADQDIASGTPLAQWPLVTAGQVKELQFFGIRTVENLAGVADSALQRLGPGWLQLRQKAKDWLVSAKDGALVAKLRSENDEMRARMDAMEKMLQRQNEVLNRPDGNPAPAMDPLVAKLLAQVEALSAAVAVKPAPVIAPERVKRKYVRKVKQNPEA